MTLGVTGPYAERAGGGHGARAPILAVRAAEALAAAAARRARRRCISTSPSGFRWRPGSAAARPMPPRRCGCSTASGTSSSTPEQLAEIGVTLGADVPMCLQSRPLIARGIGEALTPVGGIPPCRWCWPIPAPGTRADRRGLRRPRPRAALAAAGPAGEVQVAARTGVLAEADAQRPDRPGAGGVAQGDGRGKGCSPPTRTACSRACRARAPPPSASSSSRRRPSAPPSASARPSPTGGSRRRPPDGS